jgi:hypothetical protein
VVEVTRPRDYLDSLVGITNKLEKQRAGHKGVESKRLENARLESKRPEDQPQPVPIENRFYKTDNEIDDILIPGMLTPAEQCVYRFLYRKSYGWGKCTCEASYEEISAAVNISARITIQKAIEGLIDKGCIAIHLEKGPRRPRVYRVLLPCEIPHLKDRSERVDSKRLESERLNSKRTDSKRLENAPPYVQKMNVERLESKRLDSKRIPSEQDFSTPQTPPKDKKDIFKNNNKPASSDTDSPQEREEDADPERLLLLFSDTPFHSFVDNPSVLTEFERFPYSRIKGWTERLIRRMQEGKEFENIRGYLREAVRNNWALPEAEDASPRREEILEIEMAHEKAVAAAEHQRGRFLRWLESAGEELIAEAEEYADEKIALMGKTRREVPNWWAGFRENALREKFERLVFRKLEEE